MATSCARRRTLPFLPLLVSGVSGAGGSQRKPLLANYRGAPVWHAIELLSAAKLRGEIRGLNTVTGRLFLYVSFFLLEHNIIWLSTFFC